MSVVFLFIEGGLGRSSFLATCGARGGFSPLSNGESNPAEDDLRAGKGDRLADGDNSSPCGLAEDDSWRIGGDEDWSTLESSVAGGDGNSC